jgi:hypothetical protein
MPLGHPDEIAGTAAGSLRGLQTLLLVSRSVSMAVMESLRTPSEMAGARVPIELKQAHDTQTGVAFSF